MTQAIDFTISGMHCDHCVAAIDRALRELAGVLTCEIRVGSARVSFDEDRTGRAALISAIGGAGAFEVTGFAAARDE